LDLIAFVTKKLTEFKLMLSVDAIDILFRPIVKANKVETTITFRLNANGSVWSDMFSKIIIKKLAGGLAVVNGSILPVYQNNITLNVETFALLITHDLLTTKEATLEPISAPNLENNYGIRRKQNELVV
jgi:hypothetical protein